MTKKRMSWGVTIALMAITAAVTISLTYQFAMARFNERVHSINERQKMYAKLQEVDQKVRQNYFGAIDEQLLNDSIADGYMQGTGDAHSRYMTVEEYRTMQSELEGQTVGVGLEAALRAGELTVVRVFANSPADLAGIQKGDVIVAADDVTAEKDGTEKLWEAMKGDSGQKVTLKVHRGTTEKQEIAIEVTRGAYEIISAEGRMTSEGLGYVSITEFNDNTPDQFKSAVTQLQQQGITGLILDVRNNPGGSLSSVAAILDVILPAGNIVSSMDKSGAKTVLYTSDAAQLDLPIAVLVNGNSASAAELLACAVRDYKKGTLVGENTYGKGTMQQTFALTDGSAISLTIAKFYPPLSNNFDGVGLKPDRQVALTEEQKEQFYFLTDDEDAQLKAARVLLTGGTGGGTVEDPVVSQPDETVPEGDGSSETSVPSDVAAYEAGARVTWIC